MATEWICLETPEKKKSTRNMSSLFRCCAWMKQRPVWTKKRITSFSKRSGGISATTQSLLWLTALTRCWTATGSWWCRLARSRNLLHRKNFFRIHNPCFTLWFTAVRDSDFFFHVFCRVYSGRGMWNQVMFSLRNVLSVAQVQIAFSVRWSVKVRPGDPFTPTLSGSPPPLLCPFLMHHSTAEETTDPTTNRHCTLLNFVFCSLYNRWSI